MLFQLKCNLLDVKEIRTPTERYKKVRLKFKTVFCKMTKNNISRDTRAL